MCSAVKNKKNRLFKRKAMFSEISCLKLEASGFSNACLFEWVASQTHETPFWMLTDDLLHFLSQTFESCLNMSPQEPFTLN